MTVAFDVVDVLGGFCTLVRRSATLDGSVPVRVAQGCVPLLEGNAWGWQVQLTRPIELRKKLTGWTVNGADDANRMTRAAVPMLAHDGLLRDAPWQKRLERGAVEAGRTVSLFTGLLVRPRAGLRLRASTGANRRSWLYRVGEQLVTDTDVFTPLVLELALDGDVTLTGDIATLGVLPARTVHESASLAAASDVVAAHVGFYDGEYFETKKRGQVARKYRDEIVRTPKPATDGDVRVRIVGGTGVDNAGDRLIVRNAVSFTASYDGYRVDITPDRVQLEALGSEIRAAWSEQSGFHEGALLYLTKYFTPHPPGEPHFFVKAPSFIATSPGTSTLIDGIPGAGYDVMRGVVRTDAFHATPCVFQLWRPGTSISVERGTPLAQLFAYPRALDDATFTLTTAGPAGLGAAS